MSEIISRKDAKALGLKSYWTGKPCKNGHTAEREVATGSCAGCRTEWSQRYYAADAERYRARAQQWRDENAEKVKDYRRQYYQANAEALREQMRVFRVENVEEVRAYQQRYRVENAAALRVKGKAYRMENAARASERGRAYRKANPEQYAAYARNRRSALLNALGSHTAEDIKFLHLIQGNTCEACEASFDDVKAHVDHIVALSRGGSNGPDNLQLLCARCNTSKHNRDYEEWLLEQMLTLQIEAPK